MKIIHLCLKSKGLRFFKKIKYIIPELLQENLYSIFYTKSVFIKELEKRSSNYDLNLITAHGSDDAILVPQKKHIIDYHKRLGKDLYPFNKYLTTRDTVYFRNNFIFAMSCDTINKFGPSCIENGALAYLGYNIKIGKMLWIEFHENIPKNLILNLEILVKVILRLSLCEALKYFMENICSVEELKERFVFIYEKKILNLSIQSCEEINSEYNTSIKQHHYLWYKPTILFSNYLTEIGEINRRLSCIGDSNFISDGFINYMKNSGSKKNEILSHLKNNEIFHKMKSDTYKQYLINKIYNL